MDDNYTWKKYSSARAELQRINRYEENMKSIKFNNTLIHANKHDRNKVYAILRSTRNSAPKLSTDILFQMCITHTTMESQLEIHLETSKSD